MNKHPYELAFPYEEHNGDGTLYKDHYGMSLRDYFAAMAMQAISSRAVPPSTGDTFEHVAELAYATADAMLAARGAA